MILSRLPDDLSRDLIRTWIFPAVLQELRRRSHRRLFFSVQKELETERPQDDTYLVSRHGTCVRAWFTPDLMQGAYIRMDPRDACCLASVDCRYAFSLTYVYDSSPYFDKCEIRLHCPPYHRSKGYVIHIEHPRPPPQFCAHRSYHCYSLPRGWTQKWLVDKTRSIQTKNKPKH
jgi:hypothetical protein